MNGRFRYIRIAAFLTFAAPWAAFLANAVAEPLRPSDITLTASQDSLYTGERLHYVVAVRHDGRKTISVEGLDARPGSLFELVGRKESSIKLPDGSMEFRMEAELAPFGTGRQRLPGFTVTSRESGGGGEERLDVKPTAAVFISSMTDSTMTELRPIVPALSPGFPVWLLIPASALILLMLAVGYLLKRFVLKPGGPLADPAHAARQKLRSLERHLSKGLAPAEGYEALSNILREFLQNHYQFRAMEQVTQEIAEELNKRQVKAKETVLQLLERADLIKFADSRPNIDECRRSLKIAEALVAGTSTLPEEPAPPTPPASQEPPFTP